MSSAWLLVSCGLEDEARIESIRVGIWSAKARVSVDRASLVTGLVLRGWLAWAAEMHWVAVETACLAHTLEIKQKCIAQLTEQS